MSETKSRNSSIDLLKLLLSVIVVLLHFGQNHGLKLIPGGYLAVECFFMISGYFMMKSVKRSADADIGKDTFRFIRGKYASFLPVLFCSAILAFCVTMFSEGLPIKTIIHHFLELMPEIFPLQITNIKTMSSTGVAWYLSSMMLSMLVLYPLAKRTDSKFTRIICPLLIFFTYGTICAEYEQLDVIMDPLADLPILTGFFRGIAGICCGCVLCECVDATANYRVSRFGQSCFLAVELFCTAAVLYIMIFVPNTSTDFFTLPFMFVLLYSAFGRKSLFTANFSFESSKHLSSASLLIYLNHNYWNFIIAKHLSHLEFPAKFAVYVVLITGSCLSVYAVSSAFKPIWKKLKPFLKKHFAG